MNKTIDERQFSRSRQNSVEILFKGLKRKIDQRSYSKLKHSYKKKPIENIELQAPLISSVINRSKLKLSVVQNKIVDPQQAHEELLKLKEANHNLSQENSDLLRKIRKQVKIQEIYRKKLQDRQLGELQYLKVMEIKLLLEVQRLQNQLEEKEKLYQDKLQFIRSKKQSFKNQTIEKRISLYSLMIETPEDIAKILKQKKSVLTQKEQIIDQLSAKILKVKSTKQQKSQVLKKIDNQIKQLREKFKIVDTQRNRDKNSTQMLNITNLMSNLMSSSQKSPSSKEASTSTTAILKNNISSISVKNKSSIEEIEKQLMKLKEEYDAINNEVQEFMDEKIRQKILIHKEINAIEEQEKIQREIQNRNIIYQNGMLGRNLTRAKSRIDRSKKYQNHLLQLNDKSKQFRH